MKRPGIFIFLLILCIQSNKAQLSMTLNGYVSNMQSVQFEDIKGQWISDNLVHNRLNFSTYAGRAFKASVEVRNRFLYGETVKYFPGYADLIARDQGWQDLSWNVLEDSSFLLNTAIDRAYFDVSIGRFQATIGRQRINWGLNYVWNPNDIFNSYSFFDFDYVERPGSDAIRLQMYLNSTSSLELVGKINQAEEWSMAGLLRFNIWGSDFQFLGGLLDEDEFVVGMGYSGYLGPLALSGELTYLDPVDKTPRHQAAVVAGAGLSYNFPFNLFVQIEYLYNQAAAEADLNSFSDFYYRNLSLRDLSPAVHSLFTNLSYPATPLLNLGFAAMLFPDLNGFYFGPSIDLSLRHDLDLSLIVQHFKLAFDPIEEQQASLGFLRLKWSF